MKNKYKAYKAYLDDVVDFYQRRDNPPEGVTHLSLEKMGFGISRGLFLLAKSVGMEESLSLKARDSEYFPYESSFVYRGVTFSQLGETAKDSYE